MEERGVAAGPRAEAALVVCEDAEQVSDAREGAGRDTGRRCCHGNVVERLKHLQALLVSALTEKGQEALRGVVPVGAHSE